MYVCTQGRCGCFFLQFFSSLFFSCLLFLLMRLMGAVKHVLLVVARGIKKKELAETPVGGWLVWSSLRFLFLEANFCGELVSCVPAQPGVSCGQHMDPACELVVAGGWLSAACAWSACSATIGYRQQSYNILILPA
jgi:hypothetical protein